MFIYYYVIRGVAVPLGFEFPLPFVILLALIVLILLKYSIIKSNHNLIDMEGLSMSNDRLVLHRLEKDVKDTTWAVMASVVASGCTGLP